MLQADCLSQGMKKVY